MRKGRCAGGGLWSETEGREEGEDRLFQSRRRGQDWLKGQDFCSLARPDIKG